MIDTDLHEDPAGTLAGIPDDATPVQESIIVHHQHVRHAVIKQFGKQDRRKLKMTFRKCLVLKLNTTAELLYNIYILHTKTITVIYYYTR